jgi:hypothetical protein
VQSDESRRRFVEIGAPADHISVTGSLKFDSLEPASAGQARSRDRVLRYFRFTPARPVWVAGSTMKGEEAIVLRVFRRLKASQPTAVLVLAPRHPERFDDVVAMAQQEGFRTVRRSELPIDAEPRADVVVLDTIGELAAVYQVGTLVFVGGSLVPTGGHNILEPAVFGRPVVFGPHAQLRGDRFGLRGRGCRRAGGVGGAFETTCWRSWPTRCARRVSAPPPAPWSRPIAVPGEDARDARSAAAAALGAAEQRAAVPRAVTAAGC